MIILQYESKKQLKEIVQSAIAENGKGLEIFRLEYIETSFFGEEVKDTCTITGSNRPSITRIMTTNKKRVRKLATEFFASLTIKNGYIVKVT